MELLQSLNLGAVLRNCLPNRSLSCVLKLLAIVLSLSLMYTGCCDLCPPKPCEPLLNLILQDSHGRSIDRIEIGQTLNVGIMDLEPNRSYRVELTDEDGRLVSFYQLTSNRNGSIEPSPVWYHSGVIGCGRLVRKSLRPYRFQTFEEAYKVLANRIFYLTVRNHRGAAIARHALRVGIKTSRTHPQFYFSNSEGCLMNSFVEKKDSVYLTGKNLPPGATVRIFLVPNQYGWRHSMELRDVRKRYQNEPHIIQLGKNQTSFTELVWRTRSTQSGAYDAIVRMNRKELTPVLFQDDIVTYIQDTGMIVQFLSYYPPWTPGDFDIAGRMDKNYGYPYFEFHDVFEVGEEMWGAVDPAMVPASHPGGDYAAFYVIDQGTASSGLTDKTEGLEIMPMKEWCINYSMTRIWNNPSLGEYDVVVDFGSTAAGTEGAWVPDGTFNAGKDFIDRATDIGVYVVNDPSKSVLFTTSSYTYEPATTSASDPLRTDVSSYFDTPDSSVTETMDKAPLRGLGYYPNGTGPFPLVLIVHGNHNPTHPNHEGYDYLCQLLAKQGIITISVDESFLNWASGEMDARAIVLLRHLQRWREWNNTPGHTFYGKVDLNKIGLSGHSRGGEAITVANLFNTTLHNASDPDHNFNFNIKSLFAIAPVDGQIGTSYSGTPVVINNAHYFIMHGSHDGDVSSFGGQKTYDRAFPNASSASGFKGLLFVHGANHNYWNEKWAYCSNDGTKITSALSQISIAQQQDIGKVYVCAFFQLALLDKEPYKALMTGDLMFDSLPSGVTLIHQYSDQTRVDLNNYQEDNNSSTGSYSGVTNSANGISPLVDDNYNGWSWSTWSTDNSYYIFNQTGCVVTGWNSTNAIYELNLPSSIGTLVNTYPYLSFRIGQIYEDPASLNTAGADKDLSVQLELTSIPNPQPTHTLKISNFDKLPYPVEAHRAGKHVTKSVMKTVRIPLRSFVVNKSDWDLADILKIKIKFDQQNKGLVVIDDIQLTR